MLGCVYRPPGPCRYDFLLLTDASDYSFTLPDPIVVAGDFNAAGICWSTCSDPNCLLPFVVNILQAGWIYGVAEPTRNQNILNGTYTMGLLHVRTYIESSFPGRDRLPVSCKSTLSFHSSNHYHPQSLGSTLGQTAVA